MTVAMPIDAVPEARVALSLHAMLKAEEINTNMSDDDMLGRDGEKKSFQPYHSQSVPKNENLQRQASERSGTPITTMMLRNIPNKYTQNSLLQEIHDQGFAGSYDFFYLPMDVHNRSNVGYAFINFCSPGEAHRFRIKFSDHRFQRYQSRKISSVCAAHVQGLDENLHHFKNRAVTQARNSQYRPIVLKGNLQVDFDEALETAKPKSEMPGFKKIASPSAPALACGHPPGLSASCHAPTFKPGATPAGMSRDGLELAIRDLVALHSKLQRETMAKSDAMGHIAPPPDLAGYVLG